MAPSKSAGELMESKARLKRILLQGGDGRAKAGLYNKQILRGNSKGGQLAAF